LDLVNPDAAAARTGATVIQQCEEEKIWPEKK